VEKNENILKLLFRSETQMIFMQPLSQSQRAVSQWSGDGQQEKSTVLLCTDAVRRNPSILFFTFPYSLLPFWPLGYSIYLDVLFYLIFCTNSI